MMDSKAQMVFFPKDTKIVLFFFYIRLAGYSLLLSNLQNSPKKTIIYKIVDHDPVQKKCYAVFLLYRLHPEFSHQVPFFSG